MSSNDSVGIKLATFPSSAGSFTRLIDRRSGEVSRPQKVALRKISKSDRHQMPSATKAHERVFPLGSCNGFVLCGIPYRGWMRYRLLSALRTGFPLPHSGQATKATGRLHCYICNFLRVAQATLLCKSRKALIHAPFRDSLRIAMGGG